MTVKFIYSSLWDKGIYYNYFGTINTKLSATKNEFLYLIASYTELYNTYSYYMYIFLCNKVTVLDFFKKKFIISQIFIKSTKKNYSQFSLSFLRRFMESFHLSHSNPNVLGKRLRHLERSKMSSIF